MVSRLPLEDAVLDEIRPGAEERDEICSLGKKLLAAIAKSGKAEGMIVGSIARHTWVRGDRDLDVFMLFDPLLPREALEAEGLALARSIAAGFTDNYHEKYAEHPYINATIDGVDVDLVPCYNVASAEKIQSAVDRTPFHTRYITDKINGLIDDVLLLKRFAKAGGIYGSDQMTEGFSGYLCELLVLYYGGFTGLLTAAAEWRPGIIIDPEHHAKKAFDEPLIVIDPVDPRRNVSAAVSLDRMAEFVELARGYLVSPSPDFFALPVPWAITRDELEVRVTERGTYLYAITFPTPPYIEEIVVPQLKRSTAAICEDLERNGFVVHHAHYTMKPEHCMFLFELLVATLPKIRTHAGPPLWNRVNADKFREKHLSSSLPGPYVSNARYEMEVVREYTTAKDLLASGALLQVSLGRHVRQSLANGWTVDEGAGCWHAEFAAFIGNFFSRCSPLVRVVQKK
ncbi:CCA tRNA nucleotidyltransferase [Methanoregula sp.]|uniref:CCA tRNA nucleotidyltransferase n=1 Tax=Methanoregula sp. TaxID=2052170 RepID=UPI003562FEBC